MRPETLVSSHLPALPSTRRPQPDFLARPHQNPSGRKSLQQERILSFTWRTLVKQITNRQQGSSARVAPHPCRSNTTPTHQPGHSRSAARASTRARQKRENIYTSPPAQTFPDNHTTTCTRTCHSLQETNAIGNQPTLTSTPLSVPQYNSSLRDSQICCATRNSSPCRPSGGPRKQRNFAPAKSIHGETTEGRVSLQRSLPHRQL